MLPLARKHRCLDTTIGLHGRAFYHTGRKGVRHRSIGRPYQQWRYVKVSRAAHVRIRPWYTKTHKAIGPKHLAWDEHTSEILTELFQINVIVGHPQSGQASILLC